MPTPSKWPSRPIDKTGKLRSQQRKHKKNVKHRIISLENRLSRTEQTLAQALAVISGLSQELRAHKSNNLAAESPLEPSEDAATSHTQHQLNTKLVLPWESHANPEDYSWSSALSADVRLNELDTMHRDSSSASSPAGSSNHVPSVVDEGSDASSECLSAWALQSPDSQFSHETYDVVDIGAMRECLNPTLQKTFSRLDADQQGSSSLFALMDFISR